MLILILGGVRSGKSAVAEGLAEALPGQVTYVATLVPDPDDADLAQRIATHRQRRPSSWATVDADRELSGQLRGVAGTALVDSLGPWVALHEPDDEAISELVDALRTRPGDTVVVSDEVGMSVHPQSPAGRAFQSRIGTVNQRLAAVCDHTLLVVAGRVVTTVPADTVAAGIAAIANGSA